MKRIFTVGLISPAVLFLVFGTAAAVNAQKEQEKEAKPEKAQQEPKQQARPAQAKPERAQQEPKQQAKPAQAKPERAQQEPKQQARPAQAKPERAQQEPKQQAKPAQAKPERAQQEPKQQAKPAQAKPERAQQEPKQQAKPAQAKPERAQQEPKHQAKPAQQQQARSSPSGGGTSIPQRTQQQARGWQQQRGWLKQGGGWQGNNSWQQGRASAWQSQHRTWAERGGYGGYYIPDATFTLDFGDQHWFRITSQPTIVGGYPRFRQDGFWFMMVDPWPESWGENWYATDDVYVGYNNGYYLYNRTDPGDAIALSIVL